MAVGAFRAGAIIGAGAAVLHMLRLAASITALVDLLAAATILRANGSADFIPASLTTVFVHFAHTRLAATPGTGGLLRRHTPLSFLALTENTVGRAVAAVLTAAVIATALALAGRGAAVGTVCTHVAFRTAPAVAAVPGTIAEAFFVADLVLATHAAASAAAVVAAIFPPAGREAGAYAGAVETTEAVPTHSATAAAPVVAAFFTHAVGDASGALERVLAVGISRRVHAPFSSAVVAVRPAFPGSVPPAHSSRQSAVLDEHASRDTLDQRVPLAAAGNFHAGRAVVEVALLTAAHSVVRALAIRGTGAAVFHGLRLTLSVSA